LLADRGYDADWIRAFVAERGAWANIPPKRNRKDPICFSPYLYRDRNLVERFFNKIRQCPDTTSSPPTTSLSSSSPASAYGCAFMSARPSEAHGDIGMARGSPSALIRELRTKEGIDPTTSALLDDLRGIGNAAAHPSTDQNITVDDARRYRDLTNQALASVKRST
jgi:hypothetical protein